MSMNEKILFDFLDANKIEYQLFKHQPVFTCQDKPVLIDSGGIDTLAGMHSKNLFLRDQKDNFSLVSVGQEKRVDLNALSKELGCQRFSFGKPEELLSFLKLQPGSVTPFGLIFDEGKKVPFVLDKDFLTASLITFHPLRNDMTVALAPQQFLTCMEKMEHQPRIMLIPVRTA